MKPGKAPAWNTRIRPPDRWLRDRSFSNTDELKRVLNLALDIIDSTIEAVHLNPDSS
ncbi:MULTISPECIES: hypothetical protein [unclassified Polaromonas]|uniref:hypothetical protein n=1 Tax=unclassified Polaromonas TaxID=2638319 RepID=UPI0018C8E40C|nr:MULTISPECIES: hypothetical protein [unclassified Polaromonas]MBG6071497.1 hypothetical protein [Polaromonas sp. CG_9.7]MBG6113498.1 hypothetical protein [Polaromonas sp. CG_9.2]MDH6183043.1 hypothetical protein [Polaromonas sp. CG_23.6]